MSDEGFSGAQPGVEPAVESVVATIAFGSNLGTREAHLSAGREALLKSPGVGFVAASRVYQTPPVGPAGQGPYLNAVVRVRTRLQASALLARMLMIERTINNLMDLQIQAELPLIQKGWEAPPPEEN